MSTLRTVNIQHPSASAPGITLNSDGTLGNASFSNYSSKNRIINGGFDIWQRGVSFVGNNVSSTAYWADRWIMYQGPSPLSWTLSKQSSGLSGIPNCARIQRNSGATNTEAMSVGTTVEILDATKLAGQTLVFSFYARKGATYSGTLNAVSKYGKGTTDNNGLYNAWTEQGGNFNQNISLTTSWQRFFYTFSMPSNATQWAIQFNVGVAGTAGASDWVELTGIQLENGILPTTFEFESFETTLRKCQRYYQLVDFIPALKAVSTSAVQTSIPFSVEMRSLPSSVTATAALIISNDTAADFVQSSAQASIAGVGTHATTRGARIQLGNFTGLTSGTMYTMYNQSGANRSLAFSAEL